MPNAESDDLLLGGRVVHLERLLRGPVRAVDFVLALELGQAAPLSSGRVTTREMVRVVAMTRSGCAHFSGLRFCPPDVSGGMSCSVLRCSCSGVVSADSSRPASSLERFIPATGDETAAADASAIAASAVAASRAAGDPDACRVPGETRERGPISKKGNRIC